MNNQEFFTASVLHLRKQQRRAFVDTGCVYRTPQGLGCAVGGVLPDDVIEAVVRAGRNANTTASNLIRMVPEAAAFFSGVSPQLLMEMQAIHDKDDVPSAWEHGFQRVAVRYLLVLPPHDRQPTTKGTNDQTAS